MSDLRMPLDADAIAARERPNQLIALARHAVTVAMREIGNGETTGNNCGPDIVRYRGGAGGRGSWCAAFVYHCLAIAAAELRIRLPVDRTHGAKQLGRRIADLGSDVEVGAPVPGLLLPGDILVWHRGQLVTWRGHIGIVASYAPDSDTAVTVEGNVGAYPATVQLHSYHAGRWRRRLQRVARLA